MIYIGETSFTKSQIRKGSNCMMCEYYYIGNTIVASLREFKEWTALNFVKTHYADLPHELNKAHEKYLIDNNAHDQIYKIINDNGVDMYHFIFIAAQICQCYDRVADYHKYYYIGQDNIAYAFARYNDKWFVGNSACPDIFYAFPKWTFSPNINAMNRAYLEFWRSKFAWYLNVLLWSRANILVGDLQIAVIIICVRHICDENDMTLNGLNRRTVAHDLTYME